MSYGSSPFGGGAANTTSTTTLSQIVDETYNILNDTQDSNVYQESFIKQLINDEQVEVCMMKKWQFLRQKQPFIWASPTTLTTAVTTQSTSVVCGDTTNFQDSGAIWLNGDIVNYTAISSLTLTGVTYIDVAHSSGEVIDPLFAVPSDYWMSPMFYVQRSGANELHPVDYVDELNWNNERTGTANMNLKYTIHNDNNGDLYLRAGAVASGDMAIFHYLKRPSNMTVDTDVCTIPDPWALKILPKLTAAKAMLLRNDDMEGLGTKILQIAEQELFKMAKYYGQREEGMSKMIQPTYRSGVTLSRYKRVQI